MNFKKFFEDTKKTNRRNNVKEYTDDNGIHEKIDESHELPYEFDLLYDIKTMDDVEAIAKGLPHHSSDIVSPYELADLFIELGLELPDCLKNVKREELRLPESNKRKSPIVPGHSGEVRKGNKHMPGYTKDMEPSVKEKNRQRRREVKKIQVDENEKNVNSVMSKLANIDDSSAVDAFIMKHKRPPKTNNDDWIEIMKFLPTGKLQTVDNDYDFKVWRAKQVIINYWKMKRLKKESNRIGSDDPCWDNYEMVGMKDKDGKKVPNCVPKNEQYNQLEEAEYQGRKVNLNKPFRTPGESKKFAVYVMDGDKVKKVRFGDPNMEIKKDNPERRKSFRARHNCDNPGPKTKARYWSCKNW
jgi:hypothetical protein